ncbi:MAG TPA: hypothetical protein VKT78_17945 [Fimbriimonadaceae bacterium]|nr:hypothetical protein [Fimbriimonadaceae bacterium]
MSCVNWPEDAREAQFVRPRVNVALEVRAMLAGSGPASRPYQPGSDVAYFWANRMADGEGIIEFDPQGKIVAAAFPPSGEG